MKSLERRFRKIEQKNPLWSSYICFAEAIKGQDFSRDKIQRYFKLLVDPDDYDKEDKCTILKHLYVLNCSVRLDNILTDKRTEKIRETIICLIR